MLLSHVDWLCGLLEVKFILFAQNIHTEGPAGTPSVLELGSQLFSSLMHP